jgi:isopenicillin-N epimerase
MKPFGKAWLDEWGFDPSIVYLNHGTVGATPRRVLAAQRAILAEIERQPARYLLRELTGVRVGGPRTPAMGPPRMRAAAAALAPRFGVAADDLVFVDNATAGANAVLRSLPLAPGDEVVVSSLGYGGVNNAARFATRERGAKLVTIELPFDLDDPAWAIAAFEAAVTERTRLVIVDLIAADSAILLPAAEIAARCRARGALVLVDGAHAPGAIALDIPALGADYFIGNLHKWGWAPRSSAILWAPPERQEGLHPAVISWGLDQGFAMEFDLVGTRDPSPWLASPAGFEMQEEIGVQAIQRYNHETVVAAGQRLGERWGTPHRVPASMVGTMVTVPLPTALGSTFDDACRLRDQLLFEDGIEVNVSARQGRLWVRVAIQIYNDMDDVDRLGEAVERRAKRG